MPYLSKEREVLYLRNKRRERRDKLDAIKVERGCVDCGFNKHPSALHFDHRERELKRFSIAHAVLCRWSIILEEVSKCDVRCANCHAIKTTESGDWKQVL